VRIADRYPRSKATSESSVALQPEAKLPCVGMPEISLIRNEREYDRAVKRLNTLLDEVGTNERHPLYGLLDTLGTLIHAYEEEHFKEPEPSGTEMLRFFMEERGLKQSDLPEVGSKRAVSDVLRAKRDLTETQIRALANRFHVSPAVFIWLGNLNSLIDAGSVPKQLHNNK
jgi:HTH-type transcriptional regulator / antitoxin HigA